VKNKGKLHCVKCGCLRNTTLFIEKKLQEGETKPQITPIRAKAFKEMLQRNVIETRLLQGGLYQSYCPICRTITPYRVTNDRKLVAVDELAVMINP